LTPLDAQLYALTHRGNPGDVEHYVALCRGAGSVLELGCGYGRLLQALAEPERRLVGLELDGSLLALGRKTKANLPPSLRRRVTLVRGDMQGFELEQSFARVILPYNALYCLLSTRGVRACFAAVHAALEPGGLFGFDVWNADPWYEQELSPAREDEPLAAFEHAGRVWHAFERCRRASGPGRLDVTYSYVPEGRGVTRSQVVRQRYYHSRELLDWLADAGFALQPRLGSFSGARFGARATRLIVTAKKPSRR
jgi:SAM-dependent methyltransferase